VGVVVALENRGGEDLGVDAEDRLLGRGGGFDLLDEFRLAPIEGRRARLWNLQRERRRQDQKRAVDHEPIVRRR